jgi:hypothetical protein
MFLGHFGLAYAAKRTAPATSLGSLFLAAQFADLIWPFLLLAGVEKVDIVHGATPLLNLDFASYPYSHSLATLALFGALVGGVHYLVRRRWRDAAILALLVPSHWLLDLLVHVPDLPLYPGATARFGLGVWQSLPLSLAIEFLAFGGGIALYAAATRARDRIGRWASWSLAAFILIAYLGSLAGGAPPDVRTLAYSALIMWLLLPWAAWADRHRAAKE